MKPEIQAPCSAYADMMCSTESRRTSTMKKEGINRKPPLATCDSTKWYHAQNDKLQFQRHAVTTNSSTCKYQKDAYSRDEVCFGDCHFANQDLIQDNKRKRVESGEGGGLPVRTDSDKGNGEGVARYGKVLQIPHAKHHAQRAYCSCSDFLL